MYCLIFKQSWQFFQWIEVVFSRIHFSNSRFWNSFRSNKLWSLLPAVVNIRVSKSATSEIELLFPLPPIIWNLVDGRRALFMRSCKLNYRNVLNDVYCSGDILRLCQTMCQHICILLDTGFQCAIWWWNRVTLVLPGLACLIRATKIINVVACCTRNGEIGNRKSAAK